MVEQFGETLRSEIDALLATQTAFTNRQGRAALKTIPYVVYFDMTGDHHAAKMLEVLVYWSMRSKDGWVYKTAEDWYDELRLSRTHVTTGRKHLAALVESQVKRSGARATHYRINLGAFLEKLAELLHQTKCRKPAITMRKVNAGNQHLVNDEKPQLLEKQTRETDIYPPRVNAGNLHEQMQETSISISVVTAVQESNDSEILSSDGGSIHVRAGARESLDAPPPPPEIKTIAPPLSLLPVGAKTAVAVNGNGSQGAAQTLTPPSPPLPAMTAVMGGLGMRQPDARRIDRSKQMQAEEIAVIEARQHRIWRAFEDGFTALGIEKPVLDKAMMREVETVFAALDDMRATDDEIKGRVMAKLPGRKTPYLLRFLVRDVAESRQVEQQLETDDAETAARRELIDAMERAADAEPSFDTIEDCERVLSAPIGVYHIGQQQTARERLAALRWGHTISAQDAEGWMAAYEQMRFQFDGVTFSQQISRVVLARVEEAGRTFVIGVPDAHAQIAMQRLARTMKRIVSDCAGRNIDLVFEVLAGEAV